MGRNDHPWFAEKLHINGATINVVLSRPDLTIVGVSHSVKIDEAFVAEAEDSCVV
jgi:hypothetical protein